MTMTTLAQKINELIHEENATMEQVYNAINELGEHRGYKTFVGGLEWNWEDTTKSEQRDTDHAYSA